MASAYRRVSVIQRHLIGNSEAELKISQNWVSKDDIPLVLSAEVRNALNSGKPIVALESTIITHGMPYPQNLKTAQEVEGVVRSNGAVPATIAIMKGVIKVGLTENELKELASLDRKSVQKCSRRDLAYVLATRGYGATTVASTMYIAHKAGIRVFVTGGIGGVHRGVEATMDVSADLTELGRTPVTVVCAGVKSILDIPKTLEFLETQGVPVAAFGTQEFPAFFTAHSGVAAPLTVSSTTQVAAMIDASSRLGLENGMVIGVPIPEHQQAAAAPIQQAQDTAIAEAKAQGISGRDVTPFLLHRVNQLTKGASLTANIALIKNNAKVGSQIAVELSKVQKSQIKRRNKEASVTSSPVSAQLNKGEPVHKAVVVGGNALDILAKPKPGQQIQQFTSNPGNLIRQWGALPS
eukprot:TRINITY_DN12039_c0_g1_i1.p1 TRINITY_DN12039_c0_g1~~TRINITY_DN12039_c0_g1_i1.p1  ORF type:complete len:443 (-),score=171.46 TRINITY_DN12039_c0_g1_i1:189-1415(-)